MCGIAGIIDKSGAPVSRDRISSITNAAKHRGPDDEGYYFAPGIAFGHRRLSIIDLSRRGHQPMCYGGRYWITYNGEIYNYIEVRAELEKLGYQFESGSDTEVILSAYAAWGPKCLERFNGMWAFAIHDSVENIIFMARDRFGVKPLHYIDTPKEFAFASEIKQLLPLQPTVRANTRLVIEYLLTCFDGHTAETMFADVKVLPQGSYLIYSISDHSLRINTWWRLQRNPDIERLSLDDSVDNFKSCFEDAVRIRLRSDVVVGTCLSGGLDSSAASAVAATMYQRAAGRRFTAIHAKSTEARTDESTHARRVAAHLGIDLHIVEPTTKDFIDTIDDVVRTQEEPFGSPSMFMGWHVFQRANQLNCKVMLNGQGGDEVLLGYERYFAAYLRAAPWARRLRELYRQSQNSRLGWLTLMMYGFYFTNSNLRIRRLRRRSFVREEIKREHGFQYVRASAESFRNVQDMQVFEISTLQLPHLLRYEDRNSMRHSIETRLPFLDYRVVECGVSANPDFKIRDGWTKYMLRRAVEGLLPSDIVWRRNKLGFEAPERTWLEAHRDAMKKEVAASRILEAITDRKRLLEIFDSLPTKDRWAYFNIAAWERVYGVHWA